MAEEKGRYDRSKFDREYVIMQFQKYYLQRWKSQKKTHRQFAEEILKIMPNTSCDEKEVSAWFRGKIAPVSFIPAIAKVLQVNEQLFYQKPNEYIKGKTDYWEWRQNSVSEMLDRHDEGLTDFIVFLRKHIDFDSLFPINSELALNEGEGRYRRKGGRVEVPETGKTGSFLEIDRDGKTYMMWEQDWQYLEYVKECVINQVKELFEDRRSIMAKAENRATECYLKSGIDTGDRVPLTADQLRDIDPIGEYIRMKIGIDPQPLFSPDVLALLESKKGEDNNGKH